ncbi:MAG: hypothetical protein KA292_13645, partial [Sphingorhabdus sp.]|nr:hypothetical protein [Sphingorhabdus sp.]
YGPDIAISFTSDREMIPDPANYAAALKEAYEELLGATPKAAPKAETAVKPEAKAAPAKKAAAKPVKAKAAPKKQTAKKTLAKAAKPVAKPKAKTKK